MARKISAFLGVLILAGFLLASIIHIDPASPGVLTVQSDAAVAELSPPFPTPQNVKIILQPNTQNPTNVKITWDPVPGAASYNIYTCEPIPDSTFLIPIVRPVTISNTTYWEYWFSKYPEFGDIYVEDLDQRQGNEYPVTYNDIIWKCWGVAPGTGPLVTTPWVPVTLGYREGCAYYYPLNGERDRLFRVTAVHN